MAETARTGLHKIWQTYFEEPAKTKKVTADVYCEMFAAGEKTQFQKLMDTIFNIFFDCIDEDKDDKIGLDEFEVIHKVIGINDKAITKDAFNAIDTDNDGILSREGFVAAGKECVTGTDETSPYRFFFGYLI